MRAGTTHARLIPSGGNLALESSYDPQFVEAFKLAVPSTARRWDGGNKRWIIETTYGRTVANLCEAFLGVHVVVPQQQALAETPVTELIKLIYLGSCKDRGNGESSAFGLVGSDWKVVFPEQVLRTFFEAVPQKPDEKPTLYAVLMLKHDATPDHVRTSYRRLAKLNHPDVCHEPDAAQQFRVIQHAYEVLADPMQRKKYDAGLFLEAQAAKSRSQQKMAAGGSWNVHGEYRPPLRCGFVLVTGRYSLGRLNVTSIAQWEDIVRADGKVMTTSWPMGATEPEVNWV